jgi:hypothetical protein
LEGVADHQREDEDQTECGDAGGLLKKHGCDLCWALQPPKATVPLDEMLVTVLRENIDVAMGVSVQVVRNEYKMTLAPTERFNGWPTTIRTPHRRPPELPT